MLRFAGAYERTIIRWAEEWRRASSACLQLDGGTFLDVSECVEGRMQANEFKLHFKAHFLGGDMILAAVPHDPFFFFHHNGLDRLRRQWQARNEELRPTAWGYPVASPAYTRQFGTPVGLRDCLGCTSYEAGFTKALTLGTGHPEIDELCAPDRPRTSR